MGRERVLAMDLLRGLAVVAMIGVHTVNALLDPALRQGALSAVVHFASGLVAPAFLLVAGFTFRPPDLDTFYVAQGSCVTF